MSAQNHELADSLIGNNAHISATQAVSDHLLHGIWTDKSAAHSAQIPVQSAGHGESFISVYQAQSDAEDSDGTTLKRLAILGAEKVGTVGAAAGLLMAAGATLECPPLAIGLAAAAGVSWFAGTLAQDKTRDAFVKESNKNAEANIRPGVVY